MFMANVPRRKLYRARDLALSTNMMSLEKELDAIGVKLTDVRKLYPHAETPNINAKSLKVILDRVGSMSLRSMGGGSQEQLT